MGSGMIDWGALLPTHEATDIPKEEPDSREMGEISPAWGKDKGIEGKCRSASHAAFGDLSPISPEENSKVRERPGAGGVGGQGMGCARRMDNGDLITCRQCHHLATDYDPPACRIASLKPGALVRAVPGYRPVMMPQRCAGFMPLVGDHDQPG